MSQHQKKPKRHERRDNMKKIQENLNHTLDNIQEAEDSLEIASEFDEKDILKKNTRRREAVDNMRAELHDEQAQEKREK